jgi:TnpA family transposase
MPRRRVLTDAQVEALLALPTAEPDLIQHYSLSPREVAVIMKRRRPHNQLGFALQLCALRFPGRLLRPGEVVPIEVAAFVAEQLDLDPGSLADYATRAPTRYDQLDALRDLFGLEV